MVFYWRVVVALQNKKSTDVARFPTSNLYRLIDKLNTANNFTQRMTIGYSQELFPTVIEALRQ